MPGLQVQGFLGSTLHLEHIEDLIQGFRNGEFRTGQRPARQQQARCQNTGRCDQRRLEQETNQLAPGLLALVKGASGPFFPAAHGRGLPEGSPPWRSWYCASVWVLKVLKSGCTIFCRSALI